MVDEELFWTSGGELWAPNTGTWDCEPRTGEEFAFGSVTFFASSKMTHLGFFKLCARHCAYKLCT